MNKMITSALVLGAGVAAYSYAKKSNVMSARNMRKMQKMAAKLF